MLRKFLTLHLFLVLSAAATTPRLPEMRLDLDQVRSRASHATGNQIGSSGLSGVITTVLYGDPANAGPYTVLLYVPAHTTIPAHSHRDNRMAAVLSGSWSLGYGTAFNEKALKNLPPGSVYSEPAGTDHFARTTDTASIVEISGFGPTDTVYVDAANGPAKKSIK